jgi:hypothetical protein
MEIIARTYGLDGFTWARVVYELVKKHPPKSDKPKGLESEVNNKLAD